MINVILTDIGHRGVAVGHLPAEPGHTRGKTVFARFGLPGETVAVEVTSENAKYLRGDVVEVLENPSPHRVVHPWAEGGPGGVGGADLGHVEFAFQAEWKTRVLRSTLRRVGGEALAEHLDEVGIEPRVRTLPSDLPGGGWHTRTRIELTADAEGRLGMYRERGKEILPLHSMPLAVPEIAELGLLEGRWNSVIRPGDRVRAVAPSGSDPVVVINREVESAPGISVSPFVTEDVVVDGALYSYRVRAGGFWQVHRMAPETLIRLVMRAARPHDGDRVVELYAGAGLFTQPLAIAVGAGGRVSSVEGSALAVEDARANLRDFPWAQAATGKVTPRVASTPADVVVADPPRSGLGVDVAKVLGSGEARRIVLISCDPAAMARDVATLVAEGRRVTSIESVDLFPNTYHFEVVTALE